MRRGITRIELVVALAILLVTALWVMPRVMANPPESSQKSQCLSNTRQLCMAMLMYCSDHNERYPAGGRSPGSSWGPSLGIYLAHESVFQCPRDRTRITAAGPNRVYSYAYNANVAGRSRSSQPELAEPNRTVLLFEVANAAGYRSPQRSNVLESPTGDGGTAYPIAIPASTDVSNAVYAMGNIAGRALSFCSECAPRHLGKAIYGAADGHATSCLPKEVSGGRDAIDSRCGQEAAGSHPAIAGKQWPGNAAGAADGSFVLTFSTI